MTQKYGIIGAAKYALMGVALIGIGISQAHAEVEVCETRVQVVKVGVERDYIVLHIKNSYGQDHGYRSDYGLPAPVFTSMYKTALLAYMTGESVTLWANDCMNADNGIRWFGGIEVAGSK